MNTHLLDVLRKVDTPTVCNAIELAQGKRGFDNFSRRAVSVADPGLPPLVGFARTARIQASRPPEGDMALVRHTRLEYYRYMSQGPRPGVCVVQDMDYPHCAGAFWGEINNNIHRAFGLGGTVTNGLMRDMDHLVPGYQLVAGGIGPSHAFVHVLDFDVPVQILGMAVRPKDLLHADRHGAVVVPEELIPVLADAVDALIKKERIVLDAVAGEKSMSFERFKDVWERFEGART